ncbi:MAG: ATP phosphoribosyltransferase [Acidimicrobiia bacterium]|nr:ATP phosphoribosyltransferase [Acidimicrobiia bacterium]
MTPTTKTTLRLAVPKGRTETAVRSLLSDAGIELRSGPRGYRPVPSVSGLEVKLLKPQNIVEMLDAGTRDLGFAGADWVAEKSADLVELLDTGFDPVQVVAAAPESLLEAGALPARPLVIATELPRLTRRWIDRAGITASVIHTYGATEVFPPEDADLIVDITATGETLAANRLAVLDTLMESSTRLYASASAIGDPDRKRAIDALVIGIRSVLEARNRVMIELNVSESDVARLVKVLPSMREPTMASLYGGAAVSVKAAVPRTVLPSLIPDLKARGATDIVVSAIDRIVP